MFQQLETKKGISLESDDWLYKIEKWSMCGNSQISKRDIIMTREMAQHWREFVSSEAPVSVPSTHMMVYAPL